MRSITKILLSAVPLLGSKKKDATTKSSHTNVGTPLPSGEVSDNRARTEQSRNESKRARWKIFSKKKSTEDRRNPSKEKYGVTSDLFRKKLNEVQFTAARQEELNKNQPPATYIDSGNTGQEEAVSVFVTADITNTDDSAFFKKGSDHIFDDINSELNYPTSNFEVIDDSFEQQPIESAMSGIDPETHAIRLEKLENTDDSAFFKNGSDHISNDFDFDSDSEPNYPTVNLKRIEMQPQSEGGGGDGTEQKKNNNDVVGVSPQHGVASTAFQEKLKQIQGREIQGADAKKTDVEKPVDPPIDLQQMVINPQQHEINQERLKELATSLMGYFKYLGKSEKLEQPLVDKLKAEQLKLLRLSTNDEVDQEGLGLGVRDCYARMANLCRDELCQAENKKKNLCRDKLSSNENTKQENDLSTLIEKLSTLIAFFDELKRHHLSHAATPIFNKYGAEVAKKVKKTTAGLAAGYAGGTIASIKKADAGVTISGMSTTVEVRKDDVLTIDDDNEFMYTAVGSGQVKFGFDIVGKLKGSVFGKLYKGGQYRKTNDLQSMAKVLAKDSANNPSVLQCAMLMRSAGPGARKRIKKYEKIMNVVLAHTLHKDVPAPVYLYDSKVAKGAYNTSVINMHAAKLDNLFNENADGKLNLAGLIKAAYPDHFDVVQSLRKAGQAPVSVMSYAPLPVLTSGTAQRGKEKKATITGIEGGADLALKLSDGKIVGDDFGYLFDMRANFMGRRRETLLERLRPMHAMTTTSYTKDIRVSLNLWDTFERVHKNGDKENPKINLYRNSNNALSKNLSADDLTPLSDQDKNYFGAEVDIPEAFLRTVRAPKEKWGDLLVTVTKELDDLLTTYDNFEKETAKLCLVSRSTDTDAIKKEYAEMGKAAVRKIKDSVWGSRYKDGVEEKDLVTRGSKAQLEFIADSHDAISTALGSLGTHLEILKAKLTDNQDQKLENGEQSERDKELVNKINAAESKYTKLSKAVEASNIPVPVDPLFRFNTIAWGTVSTKNELESQLKVVMGGNLDLLPTILKKTTDHPIDVDMKSDALAADITVGCKYTQQDHPNYSRKGDFVEVVVSIGGANPLLGEVMTRAIKKAAKTLQADLPTTKETKSGWITDLLGGVVLDGHKRIQVVCRWHKYAELPDNKYELQYLKILEQKDDGIAPAVQGIPLNTKEKLVGIGSSAKKTIETVVGLSAGGRSGQEVRNPIFEFMGRDLGHHIINFSHLDKLYKAAETDAKKKKAEEDKVDEKNVKVDLEAVFSSLSKQLDKKDNVYKKLQFFSSNSIFQVVQDYQKFLDWKQNGKGESPRNGFMFYNIDKIQEAAKISRKAEGTAAGKGWNPVEKPSLAEPISVPDIQTLERVETALTKFDLVGKVNTDKKQDVSGERAKYFLEDKDGQAVFKAYLNILTAYKELNTAATTLHSYSSYVRDEESKLQALQQIGKTVQNTGKILSDAVKGARPILDAAPKAEAFLREKGLFEGTRKKYEDIIKIDARRPGAAKQTEQWLVAQKVSAVKNGFTGMHGFIIAYLQQVTGRYDKLHLEEARKYLQRVAISEHPLKAEMKAIVKEINKDYGTSMQVRLVTPGNEGHPVWTGDINPAKSAEATPVVILRDWNANTDEETFVALARKNKTEQKFNDAWPRENVDMQLNRLKEKRDAREKALKNPSSNLTGIAIRETMKNVGEQNRGMVKNVVAKVADIQRPKRKEVRRLTGVELDDWIELAYRKGNKNLWTEGIKEKEKREEMMSLLANSTKKQKVNRTGKDLREIKDAVDLRDNKYSNVTRFMQNVSAVATEVKHKLDKDAELMTRLSRQELGSLIVARHNTKKGNKIGSRLDDLLGAATKEREERENLEKAIKKKLKAGEKFANISLQDLHKWREKFEAKEAARKASSNTVEMVAYLDETESSTKDSSTKTSLKRSLSLPTKLRSRGSNSDGSKDSAVNSWKNFLVDRHVGDQHKLITDFSSASGEIGSVYDGSERLSDLNTNNNDGWSKHISGPPTKMQEYWNEYLETENRAPVEADFKATVQIDGKGAGVSNPEKNDGLNQVQIRNLAKISGITSPEEREQLEMFKSATPATDKWFDEHNYEIVSNNGDQNNCLLIALLQHATGLYGKNDWQHINRLATSVREDLEKEYRITQGTMLVAEIGRNQQGNEYLMKAVSKHANATNMTNEKVIFVTPYEGGTPFAGGISNDTKEFRAMNDYEVNDLNRQLIIVYGRNGEPHYEAVKKSS